MAGSDDAKEKSEKKGKSALKSWIIVAAIAVGFFVWGIIIFFTVGTRWPPDWRYGSIPDIPAQSPYSTSTYKTFPGAVPHPVQTPPVDRQHVMGREKGAAPLK